jgi:hypothetical protein
LEKPCQEESEIFLRDKNTKQVSIVSMSFDDTHTLRLMGKRAGKKPPLDFGGETLGQ